MRTQILRLFWLATLASAACGAYLSARIASLLVARSLSVVETSTSGAAPVADERRGAELLSDFRVIDDRNLFNVRPAPPPPPPVVVVPPPPPILPPTAPPPPPPPPEPPLDLKLVGTAVVAGGKSFAIVSAGPDLKVVREKEEIVAGAVLLEVRADRIQVGWRGRTEEFALYETRSLGAAPAGARGRSRGGAPVDRLPPAAAAPAAPAADSVRRVADDRWVVDGREVEQIRANPSSMMTQVRVVPSFGEGGQPDGFKVFAIRPGSLFARIGLQNGDVIRRINGVEMQDPGQALAAYQSLKDETTINIDLVRQNQAKTLTYVIQ